MLQPENLLLMHHFVFLELTNQARTGSATVSRDYFLIYAAIRFQREGHCRSKDRRMRKRKKRRMEKKRKRRRVVVADEKAEKPDFALAQT